MKICAENCNADHICIVFLSTRRHPTPAIHRHGRILLSRPLQRRHLSTTSNRLAAETVQTRFPHTHAFLFFNQPSRRAAELPSFPPLRKREGKLYFYIETSIEKKNVSHHMGCILKKKKKIYRHCDLHDCSRCGSLTVGRKDEEEPVEDHCERIETPTLQCILRHIYTFYIHFIRFSIDQPQFQRASHEPSSSLACE